MKKIFSTVVLICAALAAMAQVRVATPNIELILNAEPGQELEIAYFGGRLYRRLDSNDYKVGIFLAESFCRRACSSVAGDDQGFNAFFLKKGKVFSRKRKHLMASF